ncbi:MAG: hypothetical protein NW217_09600 [Hyphomicrobiaceae bacterium]|nr:hypothetical protein [Hyphomicrobiaceae bacterium]
MLLTIAGFGRRALFAVWLWLAARLLIASADSSGAGEPGFILLVVPCLVCLGLLMWPVAAEPITARRRPPRIVADVRPRPLRALRTQSAPRRLRRILRAAVRRRPETAIRQQRPNWPRRRRVAGAGFAQAVVNGTST